MSEWLPIETAPKDGTVHLRWSAERGFAACNAPGPCMPGKWEKRGDKWYGSGSADAAEATHWMPLPSPLEVVR